MVEHHHPPRRSVSQQVISSSPPPSSSKSSSKANNDNDDNNKNIHNNGNFMNLRRRGSVRTSSTNFAAGISSTLQNPRRRNSTLPDAVSETRDSIRSSTGDLFFPKATGKDDTTTATTGSTAADCASTNESSHWNSAPLILALLPAVAGIFFRNGSAFITDVILLVLAAIFLNWSVRLPWDWYHSARVIRQQQVATTTQISSQVTNGDDDDDDDNNNNNNNNNNQTRSITAEDSNNPNLSQEAKQSNEKLQGEPIAAKTATVELHFHELAALASCFVFPVIGTWLLHIIRLSLSRPSEGLVSNYNLTIFLLASELRPCAHLLRMVRSRTIFLQRVVSSSSPAYEDDKINENKVFKDLNKRLEEVESHVAETTAMRLSLSDSSKQDLKHDQPSSPSSQKNYPRIDSRLSAEIREALQSELEELYRVIIRRYEKRTALTNRQTEARLQQLETQLRDAATLSATSSTTTAAAAVTQRPVTLNRDGFTFGLLSCSYAVVMVPIRMIMFLVRLPVRITLGIFRYLTSILASDQTGQLSGSVGNNKRKMPQDRVSLQTKTGRPRKGVHMREI